MITRIELDGFKTFLDFSLELAPFQVIVGPNGVGKSNLFDALRLLSRLADTDLGTAFQDVRGDAGELFTILPNGRRTDRLRLAVELLVDRQVRDRWGKEQPLDYTRLRYELTIERRLDGRGVERLRVADERLAAILPERDAWLTRHVGAAAAVWRPAPRFGPAPAVFISTEGSGKLTTIFLAPGDPAGGRVRVADNMDGTMLSSVTTAEFQHALAARQELRSWSVLQLSLDALRQPSPVLAPDHLTPAGANLPSTLARLAAADPLALGDVSRDLATLVPEVSSIDVRLDPSGERHMLVAHTTDDRTFSARVLSDGTLRLLALVTLLNDPEHRGVLGIEEPENGVHPGHLKHLVRLLRDLTTDFADPGQADRPLRQLLVNTHSPVLASQPEVVANLLFATMATRVVPRSETPPLRITRIWPVVPDSQRGRDLGLAASDRAFTLTQVLAYLNSADTSEARAALTAADTSHGGSDARALCRGEHR